MPSTSSNSSSSGNKDFCHNFWMTGFNDGESLPIIPPGFSCNNSSSSHGVSSQSSDSSKSDTPPPSSVDPVIYLYERCMCGEEPQPELSSLSDIELSSASSLPIPPGCEGKTRLKNGHGYGYYEGFTTSKGTAIYSSENPDCVIYTLCDNTIDINTYTFHGTVLKSAICPTDHALIDTLSVYQDNVDADCKKRCPESSLSSKSEQSSQSSQPLTCPPGGGCFLGDCDNMEPQYCNAFSDVIVVCKYTSEFGELIECFSAPLSVVSGVAYFGELTADVFFCDPGGATASIAREIDGLWYQGFIDYVMPC